MSQPPFHTPSQARPRWGRFAAWTVGAALAAFAIGGGLALLLDDGGGEPIASETGCREAVVKSMHENAAVGLDASAMSAPAACYGLDKATLERIAGEAVTEYLDSPEAEKAVKDAMREAMESAWPSETP
ncbi:hypothetical protein [Streptomyces sp. E5N298]|uniref:hypothetical protein n=1 Tax=Streptomyces sp. E5N298 TaxID=1851983 RepID=UPI000EF56D4F|nr:hypothetical protein [Streptomyces sp. E5N298]